jgi:leader peptidase (prepilin peptidase)/N-methyltransferase
MTGPFAVTFATLFGALIGSFLNVCIHRLPRGTSIVWPASACPKCGRNLSWFENIPLFSYAGLLGRCRTAARPSRRGIPSSKR